MILCVYICMCMLVCLCLYFFVVVDMCEYSFVCILLYLYIYLNLLVFLPRISSYDLCICMHIYSGLKAPIPTRPALNTVATGVGPTTTNKVASSTLQRKREGSPALKRWMSQEAAAVRSISMRVTINRLMMTL